MAKAAKPDKSAGQGAGQGAGQKETLRISTGAREDATARLRSIKGHVEGLLRMLERDDVYCVDVLKQIKAVNGALSKTGDMILRCHLKHHVVTAHERGDEDQIVAELMEILKYR